MSEPLPEMISLGAKLAQLAAERGDAPAVTCGPDSLTYAELHRASNRLARALAAKGVKHGDLVTIGLPNSLGFATAAYARSENREPGANFGQQLPTSQRPRRASSWQRRAAPTSRGRSDARRATRPV